MGRRKRNGFGLAANIFIFVIVFGLALELISIAGVAVAFVIAFKVVFGK